MENSNLENVSMVHTQPNISELDAELLKRNFTLTPFTAKEESLDYSTITFNERGVDFTLLKLANNTKRQTGNKYKFGVVDDNYNFYWFFNGRADVRNRILALETFALLKRYCELKKLGQPFAFKST